MLQFFLNPWLLAGIAGISLPIVAHLLSRRRYDVVQWAAMQFLNPARKTRRRLRLEELLLLLIRIGLILLLTFAAARPWIPAGWLSGFHSAGSRTVVIVIDGSNSMARSDGLNSLHQTAVRRATEFLTTLGPGDSSALIDARDKPRSVIESPLQDQKLVSEAIAQLPPPSGAGDLRAATERAIGILSRSSSAAREIVVFTDRHRTSWQADNDAAWIRVDELMDFPAVKPRVWAVDVGEHLAPLTHNVAVGRIEASRDLTVPDFPLRLRTVIFNSSAADVQVPVRLLADGQPLASQQKSVLVPAHGNSSVEFEHSLRVEGAHVLSVEALATTDAIPADNVAHVAVHVKAALPVLLVRGTAGLNSAADSTFFAQIVFAAGGRKVPWVSATLTDSGSVTRDQLQKNSVVVLTDVGTIPDQTLSELREYVTAGGGLIVVCGPATTPDSFRKLADVYGLAPGVELVRAKESTVAGTDGNQVAQLSLQSGWLERFRSDPSRSFLKTQYQQWWQTKLGPAVSTLPAQASPDALNNAENPVTSQPVVLAELTPGDPLLIQTRCGEGTVFVFTSTWNRQWNDFPTRSDFVPFLHEIVFQAAASKVKRNLDFSSPIVAETLAAQTEISGNSVYRFRLPGGAQSEPVQPGGIPASTILFDSTWQPGVYRLERETQPDAPETLDTFVVNYDHVEDNMEELTESDRAKLATGDRVRFAKSLKSLSQQMYGNESRMELWAILLWLFCGMLLLELWLTRRIVRRGYGSMSSSPAGEVSPVSASL